MDTFDPNIEPDSQEQMDAYLTWCADNFMRLSQSERRTYRTAIRCAAWLLIAATAQLHLDDEVEHDREPLLHQLAAYQQLARAIERQRQHADLTALMTLRASLDCWEPIGACASFLLDAAKAAVAAMLLIEAHPLVDLWDLSAPDAWALIEDGRESLAMINDYAEDLTYSHYAVRRDDQVTAKFTWQRVNNMHRHLGAPPASPN